MEALFFSSEVRKCTGFGHHPAPPAGSDTTPWGEEDVLHHHRATKRRSPSR
jgi:hypothetical protein